MITRVKLSTIEQGLPKYRSMLAGNAAYIPTSFESIATITATGGETTLTFSGIPGTYQHLQIRGIAKDNGSANRVTIQINSDSGNNYAYHRIDGDGATVSAAGTINSSLMWIFGAADNGSGSNIFAASIIDFHDYASTSKYKTIRSFAGVDGNGSGRIALNSGLWMSTSAITTISLSRASLSFVAGTTFALYGIKG